MTPSDPIRAVREAEESLLDPRVRGDRRALEALLAPDFHEVGVSGNDWTRDDVIAGLLHDKDVLDIAMTEVCGEVVAEGLVLLTYATTDQGMVRARRMSLWRMDDARWRLVFHHGSPVA